MQQGSDKKKWDVFTIIEGKNDKSYWLKLGRGFQNLDDSINLFLDGLPTNGKLQLRIPKPYLGPRGTPDASAPRETNAPSLSHFPFAEAFGERP